MYTPHDIHLSLQFLLNQMADFDFEFKFQILFLCDLMLLRYTKAHTHLQLSFDLEAHKRLIFIIFLDSISIFERHRKLTILSSFTSEISF